MGPLDWKSSTLTTRSSKWVSCGPSLLLLFTLEDLSEHSNIYKRLILLIARNLPRYLYFAFFFNCMTNLTQICMITWSSSNNKMNDILPYDILPLELFQGTICNIERLKEGTWLLRERHKLEGNLILKGGPQIHLHNMAPIEVQLGLGTQPRY